LFIHPRKNYTATVEILPFQVESFSLQMLHYNSSFDALGFFPLDFTLIYSVSTSYNKVIQPGCVYRLYIYLQHKYNVQYLPTTYLYKNINNNISDDNL